MVSKFSKQITDLSMPHEWWTKARSMQRNFHLHLGPTNSGKTFKALEVLKKSKKGVYCGPLRLLATEIYDNLTRSGIKCSLITGQEFKITPNATHISCTIEALDLNEDYDCALIDEVQMIEDYHRGAAWTNAVLGLCAKDIHLTGESRTRKLIETLLDKTNDEFKIYSYNRLSPLYLDNPVSNVRDLKQGDCLIAFSRTKCHALKNYIEKFEPGSCSIIYGRLPPQVRMQQAEKFNSGEHRYLISTDAIGMGLNYNIKRIIFTESLKNNGTSLKELTPSEINQISGRAGRFENVGYISATSLEKLNAIVVGISSHSSTTIKKACLSPMYEQLEEFITLNSIDNGSISYSDMIKLFRKEAQVESLYFLQSSKEAIEISNGLNSLNLPFIIAHKLAQSKINLAYDRSIKILKTYAENLKNEKPVKYENYHDTTTDSNIQILEMYYSFAENYLNLSKSFDSEIFEDSEKVLKYREELANLIQCKLDLESADLYGFKFGKKGHLEVFE